MRREAFKHAELASLILNKNKRCGDFLRTFYPFLKNQVTMMYITITTKVKTIATMLVALDSILSQVPDFDFEKKVSAPPPIAPESPPVSLPD